MKKNIEIEKKFYCDKIDELVELSIQKSFSLKEKTIESDEYFTDLSGEFIKDRTCLRIRKTNNKNMEVTFKGKSKVHTNFYAKNESNIDMNIGEYENTVELFSALGYHSYTIVNKNRMVYSKEVDGIEFNIMIDNIENIGAFVEFELLCDASQSLKEMEKKFEKFLLEFNEIELKDANLPYRDFVANSIINKLSNNNNISAYLFDLDGTIINSEKIFFNSFKEILFNDYNVNISEEDYIKNEQEKNQNLINYLKENSLIKSEVSMEEIMNKVYNVYSSKIDECLQDKYTLTIIELIKMLKKKTKVGLVTTSKKIYVDQFLKVNSASKIFDVIVSREDVSKLKPYPEAYKLAIKKLKLDGNNIIAFEDSKRGLLAALNAGINVVRVNKFSTNNQNEFNDIDSLIRMLLIILYS